MRFSAVISMRYAPPWLSGGDEIEGGDALGASPQTPPEVLLVVLRINLDSPRVSQHKS